MTQKRTQKMKIYLDKKIPQNSLSGIVQISFTNRPTTSSKARIHTAPPKKPYTASQPKPIFSRYANSPPNTDLLAMQFTPIEHQEVSSIKILMDIKAIKFHNFGGTKLE
jgi:hypothetical protein